MSTVLANAIRELSRGGGGAGDPVDRVHASLGQLLRQESVPYAPARRMHDYIRGSRAAPQPLAPLIEGLRGDLEGLEREAHRRQTATAWRASGLAVFVYVACAVGVTAAVVVSLLLLLLAENRTSSQQARSHDERVD